MARWGAFESAAPELAAFGAALLRKEPAYMGTVRANGSPECTPLAPSSGTAGCSWFMEPTSPKAADPSGQLLRTAQRRAGHPRLRGRVQRERSSDVGRRSSTPCCGRDSSGYEPPDRYVLFELMVIEARCNGYGDEPLPQPRRCTDYEA